MDLSRRENVYQLFRAIDAFLSYLKQLSARCENCTQSISDPDDIQIVVWRNHVHIVCYECGGYFTSFQVVEHVPQVENDSVVTNSITTDDICEFHRYIHSDAFEAELGQFLRRHERST
jgi:hypothetical protein